MNDDINHIPSNTPNFQTELAEKLAELVPEAIADGKIDVEKLKELLDNDVNDSNERFGLFWPGKKRALRAAQQPTTATLKPDVENSKDWETTKNVFIEGDNLEVLKVLQKHYHGKIKMIYIDPPYNTGKDFVYPDNFKEGLNSYLKWTKQVNEEGQKLSTNSESEGRYHSNWLNMMYPRLKLARNLLSNDGVIFVSIGMDEAGNLRRILDEIYGEGNFVADLIWQSRTSISDDLEVSGNHNYTLVYSRKRNRLKFWGEPLNSDEYKNPDDDPRGPWKLVPLDANKPGGDTLYAVRNPETNVEFWPPQGRSWAIGPDSMQQLIEDGRVKFGVKGDSAPKKKLFLEERIARGDTRTPSSLLLDAGTTKDGSNETFALFGAKKVFDYPKPVSLLKKLIRYGTHGTPNAIVLDFFSGSGTSAHATMQLNAEDGGERRHIQVQLPEPVQAGGAARKLGYETISAAAQDRIRRAGEKIQKESAERRSERDIALDVGFRAYKLTDTNFSKWQVSSDTPANVLEQHLLDLRESADDNADPTDLFVELLLKQGYSLTEDIGDTFIAGLDLKTVLDADGDVAILAYLDERSTPTLDQLREIVDSKPLRFVILEDCFHGDDELKTNLVQICKTSGIELWTA